MNSDEGRSGLFQNSLVRSKCRNECQNACSFCDNPTSMRTVVVIFYSRLYFWKIQFFSGKYFGLYFAWLSWWTLGLLRLILLKRKTSKCLLLQRDLGLSQPLTIFVAIYSNLINFIWFSPDQGKPLWMASYMLLQVM